MARSKSLDRYPQEFWDVMSRFEKDHKNPLTIPCASRRAAEKLRFKFYGFLKAMKHDTLWQDYNAFYRAEFRVSDDGCLIIEDRDNTEAAQLCAQALRNLNQEK